MKYFWTWNIFILNCSWEVKWNNGCKGEGAAGMVQAAVWRLQRCQHHEHDIILEERPGLLCDYPQIQTWSHVSLCSCLLCAPLFSVSEWKRKMLSSVWSEILFWRRTFGWIASSVKGQQQLFCKPLQSSCHVTARNSIKWENFLAQLRRACPLVSKLQFCIDNNS